MGRGKSGTGSGGGSASTATGGSGPTGVDAQGRHTFGMGVSREALLNAVDNGQYKHVVYTHDGTGKKLDTPSEQWGLGVEVKGSVTSAKYPSTGDYISGLATVRKLSDGTYSLSYPNKYGTHKDRKYKTRAAAEKGGRTALRNYVNHQYKAK